MTKLKKIPKFNSEQEEREFWQKVDSTEYVDYSSATRVCFPNLKLTTKSITIRLPEVLIERVKVRAHRMDIPYQTLMKKLIYEGMTK